MKHSLRIFRMQFYLITLLVILSQPVYSQSISVKSFRQLTNDMDARVTYPKSDQNGDKCAIIKVITSETGFTWDGDMLGLIAVEKKTGEYWIYLPYDSKQITIKNEMFGVLRNYNYPVPILEATVYEMALVTEKALDIINNQWLIINAEPQGSKIYLDNIFEGTDSIKKSVIPSTYSYRIEASLFHTESGEIKMKIESGEILNISLKPNFGYAHITSIPKDNVQVIIDSEKTNLFTPCTTDKLLSGDHTISIVKKGFRPLTQKITIQDGLTEKVTLTMQKTRNFIRGTFKKQHFSLSAGYHTTGFSNAFFNDNLSKGNIKRSLGYAGSVTLNLFPLFFDVSYFSSGFSVKNIEQFTDNSTIYHRGLELSADYVPFSFGLNVYPYFGTGYQYSQVYAKSLSAGGSASSNASQPLVKIGVKMRLKSFLVFGEYKKGLDINDTGYESWQLYSGVGVLF